jgi:hypothetical protein
VAGNGYGAGTQQIGGYTGDGGAATSAELNDPFGVAVDASGNLFIADTYNNVIRKVVFQGPTLELDNINGINGGTYDVVVSSPYGSVTSSNVTLAVTPPSLSTLRLNALRHGTQELYLQLQGALGSYVLLSATNLTPPVNWQPVFTNVASPDGNWIFIVSNILSSPARFYRMSSTGP